MGEILLRAGVVTEEQLLKAIARQQQSGERLGEALVNLGFVSSEDVARALAEQLGLPFLPGKRLLVPPKDFTRRLPLPLAQSLGCLPLDEADDGAVVVATSDPLNQKALEEVSRLLGKPVRPVVVLSEALERTLREFARPEANSPVVSAPSEISLLLQARKEAATAVHLEPSPQGGRILFRVRGRLETRGEMEGKDFAALLSRLKTLASLDPEESGPREGWGYLSLEGEELRLELSLLPTSEGERAVINLLPPSPPWRWEDLLDPKEAKRLRSALEEGWGLAIVSALPGHGLSSLLALLLSSLASPGRVVISLEELLPYRMPGVQQVQADRRTGLDLPRLLRLLVRQDPDVIGVGEVEDPKTAEAAVWAALSGRLVIAAVTAPDATSVLDRLRQLGVDPYLLGSLLIASLSQRTLPRVCPACGGGGQKKGGTLIPEPCSPCGGTGRGKASPVAEVLIPDEEIRQAIAGGIPASELREMMRRRGWATWEKKAREGVARGVFSPEEVRRAGLLV